MSEEVSAVELLCEEYDKYHPDITKINEYVIRCCIMKEDINTRFDNGRSVLHKACYNGHNKIVRRLFANRNNFKYVDLSVE